MKPNHHLDDSTLLAYAAGTLDEAFSVVAASHVAVCPACRGAVRAAEALGGELLDSVGGASVSDDCRSRTFAALEQAGLYRLPVAVPRPAFPRALAQFLPVASLDDLAWKKKAPGVAVFDVKLPASARGQLRLLRIGAGRAMPEHGHGGEEITMVLKGAYVDHMGRFAAGDVAAGRDVLAQVKACFPAFHGCLGSQRVVLNIDFGQHLPSLNPLTNFSLAHQDLAAHPKSQSTFSSSPHLGRVLPLHVQIGFTHREQFDRSNGFRVFLFGRASG